MKQTYFVLFSLVFMLVACKTYNDEDKQQFDKEIESFIKKKGYVMEKSDSGLYFEILEVGDSTAEYIKLNDIVSFKYTGKLLNGEEFDHQEKPVEFVVNDLIAAWQETMFYLKKGGKAHIIAPPQLGYGDHDLDDIPKNSILEFELEIIDVK